MKNFLHKVAIWSCVAGLLPACQSSGEKQVKSKETIPVTVLQPTTIDLPRSYVADIQAIQFVEIKARVEGFIQQVLVDEGQLVKKGQPMFRLNSENYMEVLKAAEANYKQTQAQLELANYETERVQRLVDKQIISPIRLDQVKREREVARMKVEQARAEMQRAQMEYSYTTITAPFTGYVDRIPYKVGSLVNPESLLTTVSDISEIFAQGLDVQLEKINALRGAELAIVVVLSIAAGAWMVMFIANTFFATKTQENKVVTRRAKKKVVKEVEKIVPAPWESMVETNWLLDNCRTTMQSLAAITTPGWKNGGITCSASGVVTSWRREFGRLSWIEMALTYSGMSFTNKTVDDRGISVTVSIPFQSVKKVNSIPTKTMSELRNMINDLFQTLNMSISLSNGKVKAGNKVYEALNFKINSRYDPEIWKPMLTKFSGLKINNIRYNGGVWNYEGTIYVQ